MILNKDETAIDSARRISLKITPNPYYCKETATQQLFLYRQTVSAKPNEFKSPDGATAKFVIINNELHIRTYRITTSLATDRCGKKHSEIVWTRHDRRDLMVNYLVKCRDMS